MYDKKNGSSRFSEGRRRQRGLRRAGARLGAAQAQCEDRPHRDYLGATAIAAAAR
jgi:hypothetical protein